MKSLKEKNFIAPAFAILIIAILTLLSFSNVFNTLQLKFADNLYNSGDVNNDIVIVAIDDTTIDQVNGLGDMGTWSRSNYAKVLRVLERYNPKAIAFDIYFRDPRVKEGDEDFSTALRESTVPVVIAYMPQYAEAGNDGSFHTKLQANPDFPLADFLGKTIVSAIFVKSDSDDVFRKSIPFIYDQNRNERIETLPFAVARIFLNLPPLSQTEQVYEDRYSLSPDQAPIQLDDGQMPIRFFSGDPLLPSTKNNKFSRISFKDVYNQNFASFNPETFKGKVFLIGQTTTESKDTFTTPVSGSYRMPGVEVHANAIQTILEQKFLRYMYDWEKILLIILFAFASVFVFSYTRIRWSLLYLVGMAGGYTLLAPVLFDRGLIVDLVHPYLALGGAFVSVYMYRYVTEFREKRELKGAFSKYVNPTIVNQIMAHPEQLKLGGEKRQITVMFTDIAHFTTISESLKPESVVALINEYLAEMCSVILEEGGTLDKFEGDAIVAFFGAPLEQPDHAGRAVRAALKMRKKLVELMKKWKTDPPLPGGENKPIIDFRCGISTGDAIVGNIGFAQKLEYTAMGDIVNLGSRLEGANKDYGINVLISEDTYKYVKDLFVTREIDLIKVMGKTHPVRIYELLAEAGQSTPEANQLLKLYNDGIGLFHQRKFADGLAKFQEILMKYPDDGPSKYYLQFCEIYRNFPPPQDWDGVIEKRSK